MVGESLLGQTDKFIKVSSEMIFDMVKVHTNIQEVKLVNFYGKMAKLNIEYIPNNNRNTDAGT